VWFDRILDLKILGKKIYRNAHGILAPPRHGGNGVQMWKAAGNMRKKQPRTADKGDPPVWGFGDGRKTNQTSNKNHVTHCLVLVTRSLMSYTPHQVLLLDQIKEDELGWECSTHGTEQKCKTCRKDAIWNTTAQMEG